MAAQSILWNKAIEVSNSTKIDLLITNMIIINRVNASFPVKMADMPKLQCEAAGHVQQAKPVLHVAPLAHSQAEGRNCFDNLFLGWRHGGHFALFLRVTLRSQFGFDYSLQNCRRGRKLSSAVFYRKPARSVSNFSQYGESRFRKKSEMAAKNILKPGLWDVYTYL